MASCALYTSGSLWCQCRWCGLPQEHGAPCVSALPIPSGNRTASSSWSRAPTETTHSLHIALTGGEVGGREGRAKGPSPRPSGPSECPWGTLIHPPNPSPNLGPQRNNTQKEVAEGELSLAPPLTLSCSAPSPCAISLCDFHPALCSGLWALCLWHPLLTRAAALHGTVGCCGALGTGWIAAALVQVQALLTLGAEVVAEAGLTVLNLAFCRQKQNGVWPRSGWANSFIPGLKAYRSHPVIEVRILV